MSHPSLLRNAIAVSLLCCSFALAAIPGADNPKCFTEHDYRQQVLEFNRRTLVGAYQQVGHHDPKWDDTAKNFLDAMAIRNSDGTAEGLYLLPDKVTSANELEAMGRAAVDAGCDDPLVIDMYCLVLHDDGKSEQMRPMLRKNLDPYLHSQYPIFRAASCIRRAVNDTDPKGEADLHDKYMQMLHDADLATMSFNKWEGPIDRRILFTFISADLEQLTLEQWGDFYRDCKANNADPWLLNMVGGQYHVKAAWKARGGGYVNTVTQLGAEGFSKELGDANECFQAAYKLYPTYPEAANEMIAVAMGQSDTQGLRQWFDRAVTAQFDYEPAYRSYLFAIYPRWFGNHYMMYAFGKECADTKRFDTRVPRQLMVALNDIYEDSNQDFSYWRTHGVFEQARDVLTGYADTSKEKSFKNFYNAEIAGWAWRLNRYDDARAALDKTDGTPNWGGMGEARAIADRTTSCIYAMTGPSKADLQKAEAANAAGNIDAAITAYDALKDALKPATNPTDKPDHAAPWILGRDQELKWQKQFDGGDWVDLMPTDSKMAGWWCKQSSFTCNGKSIIGTTTSPWGTMAICGNRFGSRYELQCRVELAPIAEGESVPKGADAGLLFGWHAPSSAYAIRLSPVDRGLTWVEPGMPAFHSPGTGSSQSTNIDVKVWDGMGDTLIDSQPWFVNRPMYYTNDEEARIGINGASPTPGVKYVISDLKIRKLADKPDDIQLPDSQ